MSTTMRQPFKSPLHRFVLSAWLAVNLVGSVSAQFNTSSPTILTERQITSDAAFGQAIAVGDFNGRGALDLAVSNFIDRVTVFFGENSLAVNSALTITGPEGSQFGVSLASGDFNSDGKTDLAIGALIVEIEDFPFFVGKVFVEFGGSTFNAQPDLQLMDPAQGDDLGLFGFSLAVGDVNGDGLTDLIVGAPERSAVVIFSGVRGSTRFGTNTLSLQSPPDAPDFGTMVAVGDVNGDGTGDIIASSPMANADGRADIGRVFVYFGGQTIARNPDLVITNPDTAERNQEFGLSLAAADLDGDMRSDLIIGAPAATVNRMLGAGKVHVFLTSSPGFPASPAMTFQQATARANSQFGISLAVGDVNRDGTPDILVGAPGEFARSRASAGRVYIFLGGTSTNPSSIIEPPTAVEDGQFGFALALANLVADTANALELVATAPGMSRSGRTYAGVAYLFRAQGT
ncbi:MAG TPA: FG-GAP-like repeat-containing protein [Blastocatellia bacterium]|nr:FG-GAP-like repeat-containing protein [Blastocatellia bacterium]